MNNGSPWIKPNRGPPAQTFRPIGTVQLVDDVETVLQVSSTDTDGFVILDALQLILVGK
mgnify:CR=1 FL=1